MENQWENLMKHIQVKLHPKITLKKNIYILHKESGAYFRTILFSQELSIFFRITGKIFDIYFLFFAVVIKSDSDIEQYFDYYSIKPI